MPSVPSVSITLHVVDVFVSMLTNPGPETVPWNVTAPVEPTFLVPKSNVTGVRSDPSKVCVVVAVPICVPENPPFWRAVSDSE